jgi:hypothetical protein
MRFKHLLLAISLFSTLFSCGCQRYYNFTTDPHGSFAAEKLTLIDTDQLSLDFSIVWFSSSSDSRFAEIYLDLQNKGDIPFSIKDIAIERVLHSDKSSPVVIKDIQLIGPTKVDPIGGWEVPLAYNSFDQIEEVNRIVNPYSSVKDLKRIQLKIQTPSYADVSNLPNTIEFYVFLNTVQSGKPVQYKQKVSLHKKCHYSPPNIH